MAEEVTPVVITATQNTIGKYVTKPPLTEKLLKKPPFRFLHDVINAVVRETGFLKGLFSEGDLLSDNVKDREAKVAFLNTLITAVKTISGIDLQVRASKIIAGLEPVETNKLLQAIGTCIDKKLDSKEYINQLKGKSSKTKTKEPEKAKKTTSKSSVKSNDSRTKKSLDTPKTKLETPKSKTTDASKTKTADTPKSKSTTKTKDAVTKKSSKTEAVKGKSSKDLLKPEKKTKDIKKSSPRIPELKLTPKPAEIVTTPKVETLKLDTPKTPITPKSPKTEDIIETKPNEEIIIEPEIEDPKPMERPKSARPRSGDFKQRTSSKIESDIKENNDIKEIEIKNEIDVKKMPEIKNAVEKINKPPEMKMEIEKKTELIMRPKSSLRPPSVRPSSARPGAPRLRPESALPIKEMVPLGKINVIVENFSEKDGKDDDEEETVVIQNIPDEIPDPILIEKSLDMPADKGHLVEQILEQIQGPEQLEEQVKGAIDWEQESSRGRDATSKEINQLRASIQSLTRTANPLGKLMSYLHEDVEAMHSELDTWTNMKKQFASEIAKQKRVNTDSNQPLINQLRELEENITKQREEIALVRFNVLRNEERIRDLVGKQIISQ